MTDYINIGPFTWEDHLLILLTIYESGDSKGRRYALEELRRMAKAADIAVDMTREKREE